MPPSSQVIGAPTVFRIGTCHLEVMVRRLASSVPHLNRSCETNQSLTSCVGGGGKISFTEASSLVFLMSEISQRRLRCVPISLAIPYYFSSGEE